eukprot:gene2969-3785_t
MAVEAMVIMVEGEEAVAGEVEGDEVDEVEGDAVAGEEGEEVGVVGVEAVVEATTVVGAAKVVAGTMAMAVGVRLVGLEREVEEGHM